MSIKKIVKMNKLVCFPLFKRPALVYDILVEEI